MKKIVNVKNVFLLMTLFVSTLYWKVFEVPFWITLLILFLWLIFLKLKKYKWIVIPFISIIVLYLNRLVSFKISDLTISFDWEQSFLGYPGISKSIDRYYNEGLIIPYSIREIFYGKYLLLLPWFGKFFKQISPYFWIRLLGFSGFYLLVLGLIDFLYKKKNIWIILWFSITLFTSSLRVIGDSFMAAYSTIPAVIYLTLSGLESKYFKDRIWIWLLLLLIDILLR